MLRFFLQFDHEEVDGENQSKRVEEVEVLTQCLALPSCALRIQEQHEEVCDLGNQLTQEERHQRLDSFATEVRFDLLFYHQVQSGLLAKYVVLVIWHI